MSIETNVIATTSAQAAKNMKAGISSTGLLRLTLCAGIAFLIGCGSTPQQGQKTAQTAAVQSPISETAASDISPVDQTQYLKALDQLDTGDAKLAAKALQKLNKKYSANAGLKANLATAYLQLGDIQAARKIVDSAANLKPVPPQLHNISGLLFVEEKKFKDAELAYRKALEDDKNYATAHYNIALLYDIYYQDIAKAYAHYNRYLALVGEDQATKDWVEQLKYSLD